MRSPVYSGIAVLALSCGASNPVSGIPAPPPPRSSTSTPVAKAAPAAPILAFAIQDGKNDNRFFRQGNVAAHIVTTAGDAPRVVVAFPAGNVGAGLWYEGPASPMAVDGELTAVERADDMRGVAANIRAHAPRLRVKTAILGSIRALRDYGHDGTIRPAARNTILAGAPVVLERTTLDGHHLEVSLEAVDGTVAVEPDGNVVLTAGTSGEIVTRLTVLSDVEPLAAVPTDEILTADAADDVRARSALTFLTYEQKILAGSWQYLTYFGRDTLLSTRLLMPVLQPSVIEAAVGAVIERLSPEGEVAHEETIGEWAILEDPKGASRTPKAEPHSYDYKMVDDDFMLAPVLTSYLETDAGRSRAKAFFARRTSSGRTFAEMVRKNVDRVVGQAAAFAAKPTQQNLIRIGDGLAVGNWRDSEEGLGHGLFPYDVNAALVPAALQAAARLYAMDAFGEDPAAAKRARQLAGAWTKAEPLFRVTIGAEDARRRLTAYGAEQKLDVTEAVASIDGPVSFPALSLDAKGAPIPIEHSDDGFVMMFGEPTAAWLVSAANRILRPFPAGLRTPVGIVVANPAYATAPALRNLFTRDHYHGTVVWSWQQALLLSGLRRQLGRSDLDRETINVLTRAEQALTRVIEATKEQRTSELWSFSVDARGFYVVPFGQGKGHHTEANAVQLWSTVYLALDRKN